MPNEIRRRRHRRRLVLRLNLPLADSAQVPNRRVLYLGEEPMKVQIQKLTLEIFERHWLDLCLIACVAFGVKLGF